MGGGVGWLGLHILNEKYSISQLGDKTPPWTCNTSWCFLCTVLYHGNTPTLIAGALKLQSMHMQVVN